MKRREEKRDKERKEMRRRGKRRSAMRGEEGRREGRKGENRIRVVNVKGRQGAVCCKKQAALKKQTTKGANVVSYSFITHFKFQQTPASSILPFSIFRMTN